MEIVPSVVISMLPNFVANTGGKTNKDLFCFQNLERSAENYKCTSHNDIMLISSYILDNSIDVLYGIHNSVGSKSREIRL